MSLKKAGEVFPDEILIKILAWVSLNRDQVAGRNFDDFESPATSATVSAAWSGTNVTTSRETSSPIKGEGSLKVVVAI